MCVTVIIIADRPAAFRKSFCCLCQKLPRLSLHRRAGPAEPRADRAGSWVLTHLDGTSKPLGASRDLAVLSCLGFHSTHPRISDGTLQQLRRRSPACKRGSRRPCLDGQDSYSQSPGFPWPCCLFCAKRPNAAHGPFLRLFPQRWLGGLGGGPPTLGPALLPAGGASHCPCRSGGVGVRGCWRPACWLCCPS